MLIPERLANFNVYGGPTANQLIGAATVELPSFEAMTETVSGAGIAGEYASPVPGHFASQMVKVAFRTLTREALALLAPIYQVLQLRGAIQVQDPGLGAITTQAMVMDCRGQVKTYNPGKMEPGKVMGAELDLECARIAISLDGVPYIEIDKFNMVYKVAGVDYLAKIRRDLGGV